jgi:hypothetical protein
MEYYNLKFSTIRPTIQYTICTYTLQISSFVEWFRLTLLRKGHNSARPLRCRSTIECVARVHTEASPTSLLLFAVHFWSLCWYDLKRERHYFETQELFKDCIPFSWERFALLPPHLRNSWYSPVLFSQTRMALEMDGSQRKEIVMRNWLNGKHELTLWRKGFLFFGGGGGVRVLGTKKN